MDEIEARKKLEEQLIYYKLTLNNVCWELAEGLGLLDDGQTSIEMAPLALVRLAIKRANEA